VIAVTVGLMVPPGGQGNSAGPGFISLGALSLGLYALAVVCTRSARRADQSAPEAAVKRAA